MNRKKVLIFAGISAVLLAFGWWQNNMLTVSEYSFASPKVGEGLDGFRIVQISDLHNKDFGSRLTKKVAELEPDIIVITGDFLDSNHTSLRKADKCAAGLAGIAPCYFIDGNHELLLGDDELSELYDILAEHRITPLLNASAEIERNGSAFVLTGLADESLGYSAFTSLSPDLSRLNVVLAHEPQFIGDYSDEGADLVLTGHAHGGQFRVPFTDIGLIAPDQGFFPKYTSGVHRAGGCEMVVSRGLGNSIIPLRLFNFPEIVVVTLESAE